MTLRYLSFVLFALLLSCSEGEKAANQGDQASSEESITLYTHRHYDTDKKIIADFEAKTGIKVNVVKANADELIVKMQNEGEQSPADLLITVDAGRLVRATDKGLLQPASSEVLTTTVPEYLRDSQGHWYALTKRARVIVYDKEDIDPADLSTYEALTEDQWKEKVLIRSSGNIYNQSLMASIIANDGEEAASQWAKGMVNNMARAPKGNDRDQVKAIMAGEGDLAIINTYYLGKLLNSADSSEILAGQGVKVFFPNQADRGAHINVSGIGLARYAPNKENAIKFMEYLVSKEVQELFAEANYEYPVNPEAKTSALLDSWGSFKEDELSLSQLGILNRKAVIIMDEAGWQ